MEYKDNSLIESRDFYCNIKLGNKKIDGRFVVPSGIRCTNVSTIKDIFDRIPEIGIIGMGGIITKDHIKQYFYSGADFFGIGFDLMIMIPVCQNTIQQ